MTRLGRRLWKSIELAFFFLGELVISSLQVAWDVLTPRHRARPGVLAVPLDLKTDSAITTLANLISLTPGSLSLDVSDDRTTLFVHIMFIDDPESQRAKIKDEFERRVAEAMT